MTFVRKFGKNLPPIGLWLGYLSREFHFGVLDG